MIIVPYSFNFRSAPRTYSHRNISGRKEIIRATSYDHSVSSYKFNVWFCLGLGSWFQLFGNVFLRLKPRFKVVWSQNMSSVNQTRLSMRKKSGRSGETQLRGCWQRADEWNQLAEVVTSQLAKTLQLGVATISFLPGLARWPCAVQILMCWWWHLCLLFHSTAPRPRIPVRPALVVECRIAARTAMVSRPPPRLAHCPI